LVFGCKTTFCNGKNTELLMSCYFDDALPAFVNLVFHELGELSLVKNFFLRDASGRLAFIVGEDDFPADVRRAVAKKAENLLNPYAELNGFSVATPEELFDDRLKSLEDEFQIFTGITPSFPGEIRVLDRRVVGGDWLESLKPMAISPPRLAFASIKGGVGRSTALCVLAAYLSANGKRVLAVDMDLEAPGLGNMLLPGDTLPEYGLLDYLTESQLSPLNDQFFADLVATSWIGGGVGRVDVIPALGRKSLLHPQNVLGKIARAYLSNSSDGLGVTFNDRVNELLSRIAGPFQYDAILIDARAGLHETTASAIIGLGASVLLFGIDQPQTYSGYELLLSHLGTLPPTSEISGWNGRISFVEAKATSEADDLFSEKIGAIYKKHISEKKPLLKESEEAVIAESLESLKDEFNVDWSLSSVSDDVLDAAVREDSPPCAQILEKEMFRKFDRVNKRSQLEGKAYDAIYGEFLALACGSLKLSFLPND
jgi:Mrp family chromosome partitioning ATPase